VTRPERAVIEPPSVANASDKSSPERHEVVTPPGAAPHTADVKPAEGTKPTNGQLCRHYRIVRMCPSGNLMNPTTRTTTVVSRKLTTRL
jgi:hypothetical protein